jgi:NAD dependent epimerase/dehydratase family enzyme
MRVTIAGATGLIGRALTASLTSEGHEVIALSRTTGTVGRIMTTVWDASFSALPRSAFEGVDAFVNLAGASIDDGRWGEAQRRAIIDSRITTTRRLVEAMREDGPSTLISGSAVGYLNGVGSNVNISAVILPSLRVKKSAQTAGCPLMGNNQ